MEGIVLLRKGANADQTLLAIHNKVQELNEHILPPGVRIVPFLDRSEQPLHDLSQGGIESGMDDRGVTGAPAQMAVSLSRECSRGGYCRADYSIFAAIRFNLPGSEQDSREPAVAGGAGFRNGGGRGRGDRRKHSTALQCVHKFDEDADGTDTGCGVRGIAAGVFCPRHYYHRVFADFHAAKCGRAVI